MARTASTRLPRDFGTRLASGDAVAFGELVAARAAAVHDFAAATGVPSGERPAFVAEVLGAAFGARDVDRQLVATARALARRHGGAYGDDRRARRLRRRALRRYRAARAAAVPVAVAGAALRALDRSARPEPVRVRAGAQVTSAAASGRSDAAAGAADAARPRSTGPTDWLPPALRGVNGVAPERGR